jgi:hypothetical protein
MKLNAKELQKLRGVGEVLSRRLVDAGLHSYERIAAVGEDGLAKIKGINPRMIRSILDQASELADSGGAGKNVRVAELKKTTQALKAGMENSARVLKERLGEELASPGGRKLEKEFLKTLHALERVEGKLELKVKKAGKGLARAEKKLAGLAEAGAAKFARKLKKARKSLKKVLA